jgi:hypothetical protein
VALIHGGSASSNLAFYEVAAQVIPVLFLALAVENRLFGSRKEKSEPATDFLILAGILLGVVAEMVSINALITQKPAGDIERTAVIYTIVLLLLPFVVRAALPSFAALATGSSRTSGLLQVAIAVLTVGGLVVSVLGLDLVSVAATCALILFLLAIFVRNFEADYRKRRADRQQGKEK